MLLINDTILIYLYFSIVLFINSYIFHPLDMRIKATHRTAKPFCDIFFTPMLDA